MLILLPPSEGKTAPRRGKPLDLAALTCPGLTDARRAVIDALVDLTPFPAPQESDTRRSDEAVAAAMSRRPSDRLKLQHRFQPLRRASKWPVWADVTARLGLAFLLIAFVVLVHWIDRAGLKDSHDGHISFLDVVYFTMISVTTTGFGDIAPVSDRSRLIEASSRQNSPITSSFWASASAAARRFTN